MVKYKLSIVVNFNLYFTYLYIDRRVVGGFNETMRKYITFARKVPKMMVKFYGVPLIIIFYRYMIMGSGTIYL